MAKFSRGNQGGPRRHEGPRRPVRPTRASKGCPRTRTRGTCASWRAGR